MGGGEPPKKMEYLAKVATFPPKKSTAKTVDDFNNINELLKLMEINCTFRVGSLGSDLAKPTEDNLDFETKWNKVHQVLLCDMAKCHAAYLIA